MFAPTTIAINRRDVLLCTLLHQELYNSADTYPWQIDLQCFQNVFAIVQLLSHVNMLTLQLSVCKNMINYK